MKRKTRSTQRNPDALNTHDLGYFQKNSSISTIYIGNLVYSISEGDLKDLFSKFGAVTYVRLMRDKTTERSKGFAFIQMTNRKSASEAVKSLSGQQHMGRTLKVSFAKDSVKAPERQQRAPRAQFTKSVQKEEVLEETPKPFKRKPKRAKGLEVLFNHLKGK